MRDLSFCEVGLVCGHALLWFGLHLTFVRSGVRVFGRGEHVRVDLWEVIVFEF